MAPHRIGDLTIDRADGIATLTIDRPAKLNALTNAFWADLRAALTMVETDGQTRVVILTGAGEKAFSAGGDIGGFADMDDGQTGMRAFQIDAMAGFAAIERSPLTVIAAVNGYALGGGCELTLACDFAIASETATFGMPEAALGLIPGFGAIRAPEVIGRPMAKYLVATGDRISALRALEIGLVQAVVAPGDLMDEARALARKVAANSPYALAVGKRLMNRQIDQAAFDYSIEAITMLQCSDDRAEGVRAFVERRAPRFGGGKA
ncbi:MAG: enoyl-CoA hydratase-related protein [Brevundimonas sp.]|uniref:enoyl-CoA hydratase/isomerase family protein n=1 Tax=Brevundimonas sp. TaxID=1871086 RepID=UPI002488C5B5|nr:enoyl-CoA hydratase-related protein [Brevundimonas sp.]MDI1327585.1 enoyl-CoA hydratase-related protein [Brevundimonas sp.]